MTQIIISPSHTSQRSVIGGLSPKLKQLKTAQNLNDVQDCIEQSPNERRLIVLDYRWCDEYELILQDNASSLREREAFHEKNSLIFIHANPNWVSTKLCRQYEEEFGFVGFATSKETYENHSRPDRSSVLCDVLTALSAEIEKNPEQVITPEMYREIKANLPKPNPNAGRVPRLHNL